MCSSDLFPSHDIPRISFWKARSAAASALLYFLALAWLPALARLLSSPLIICSAFAVFTLLWLPIVVIPVGVPICVEPICCGAVKLPVVLSLPVLLSLPAPWLFLALLWLLFVMMPVSRLSPCMRYGIKLNNVSI